MPRPRPDKHGFRICGGDRSPVLGGLHSGIPFCCISFFVLTWLPRMRANATAPYITRHWKRVERACDKLGEKGWPGYVPCPHCVKHLNFVKIHHCTKRCKNQPGGL